MQDINDIIWPKNHLNFSFGFMIIFGVILFFILFYLLLKHYLTIKQEKIETEKKLIGNQISKKQYFLEKLNNIIEKSDLYNKSEFYSLLNDLLREFLEYKGLISARNMTFKELEKNKSKIDTELFDIIKSTYFEEFKEDESDLDRRKILKDIKSKLEM